MIKFVLLSTQRSGTNFIEYWLNSHPQVRCHSEIFLESYQRRDGFVHYCRPKWFSRFCLNAAKKNPHALISKIFVPPLVEKFIADVYLNPDLPGPRCLSNGKIAYQVKNFNTEKAAGFKLMYSHIRTFPAIEKILKREKIFILHLIRKNKLKIILSGLARAARGRAVSTAELPPVQVLVDHKTLLQKLQSLCNEEKMWRERMSDNPYLEITYEDFFADHEITAGRIEKFFGVQAGKWTWPKLKKLNPDSVKEIAINYNEVAATLQGTPFEQYLD